MIIQTISLFDRVEASLESIRPYLAVDGGDIRLIEVTADNVVRIKLLGNCSDCNMSEMTMKAGVEETILKSVPEITKVEAV
ncbi:NifU family protein [Bacteroidota bacterium]|nr:NifU family protein [Bacteroidota bacterium]